jgi:hypothetical protein
MSISQGVSGTMLTEKSFHENPLLIKAFTGLPPEGFWELVNKAQAQVAKYERERHDRPDRQRAVGGGRNFDQPLVIRIAQVLTYLRLHVPQKTVACLFGGTQSDISRDLRRLLPLLRQVLPVPEIWEKVEEGEGLAEGQILELEQLADGRAIVDATEQQVYRSQDSDERKEFYSGKKKNSPSSPNWLLMENITLKPSVKECLVQRMTKNSAMR